MTIDQETRQLAAVHAEQNGITPAAAVQAVQTLRSQHAQYEALYERTFGEPPEHVDRHTRVRAAQTVQEHLATLAEEFPEPAEAEQTKAAEQPAAEQLPSDPSDQTDPSK